MSGAVPTVWNDVLALPRRAPRRAARLAPADPVRWLRRPASRSSRRSAGAPRPLRPAGVGHDRDVAGRLRRQGAGRGRGRGRVGLPRLAGPAAVRCRGPDRRRRRSAAPPRRRVGRRAGGARPLGDRQLLQLRRPRRERQVPRRLAADRRRRHARRARLHHADRPGQGRDQVRRRVDQLGRPRERADGPSRRARGSGRRHPRREVAGAPARDRGPARGRDDDRRGAARRTSARRSRSGSCPTPGRSSTRCRAPRSASSTRRCCAASSPTAATRSGGAGTDRSRPGPACGRPGGAASDDGLALRRWPGG